MKLTAGQKHEICRLRGAGYDFKTIGRMERCTPDQARNVWYRLPRSRRAALGVTPSTNTREDAMQRAKAALAREITLARQERATAPLFKVTPLLW